MSIVGLSTSNFSVHNQTNGKHLTITIPGNVLVFFKKTGCPGCSVLEPIYAQLSKEDKRVTYGIVDLQYNTAIVSMSRDTSTPIQTVPQLFLYVNGRPHAKFKGAKSEPSVRKFINDALNTVPQNQYPAYGGGANTFVPSNISNQNMYGGNNYGGNSYAPEITAPRQASQIAHGNQVAMSNHPSMKQQCDPETEDCLMVPADCIPHNLPWESDFRKYMDTGKI